MGNHKVIVEYYCPYVAAFHSTLIAQTLWRNFDRVGTNTFLRNVLGHI